MNSFPQFMVPIQDKDVVNFGVHFVALFSERKDAIPVILLHDWPGENPVHPQGLCSTEPLLVQEAS